MMIDDLNGLLPDDLRLELLEMNREMELLSAELDRLGARWRRWSKEPGVVAWLKVMNVVAKFTPAVVTLNEAQFVYHVCAICEYFDHEYFDREYFDHGPGMAPAKEA